MSRLKRGSVVVDLKLGRVLTVSNELSTQPVVYLRFATFVKKRGPTISAPLTLEPVSGNTRAEENVLT